MYHFRLMIAELYLLQSPPLLLFLIIKTAILKHISYIITQFLVSSANSTTRSRLHSDVLGIQFNYDDYQEYDDYDYQESDYDDKEDDYDYQENDYDDQRDDYDDQEDLEHIYYPPRSWCLATSRLYGRHARSRVMRG